MEYPPSQLTMESGGVLQASYSGVWDGAPAKNEFGHSKHHRTLLLPRYCRPRYIRNAETYYSTPP